MTLIEKFLYHIQSLILFLYESCLSIILYKNFKVYLCNHLTIGIKYLYAKKTLFPHPVGIVIGSKVKLGNNCTIYQNVTIGTKDTKNYKTAPYPRIGNNVTIYANTVIFGDITIGDNAVIGANSLINQDVPANSVYGGNPARIIKNRNII
jgi:serine O-acetyltransferase